MKKVLLIYVSILLGVFIFMSLLTRNDEYAVEREIWNVNKEFAKLQQDPEAVPDQEFESMAQRYKDIIKKYPDSEKIRGIYLILGKVYLMKEDYAKARETFETIIEKYENQELKAQAYSNIGVSHEMENNWPQALEIYERLMQDYPLTSVGLGMPVYIANYYQGQNDYKNTISAYAKAIKYYQDIVSRHPHSVYSFTSLRYLSNCYLALNRWEDAVDTLKTVLLEYPEPKYLTPSIGNLIVKTINTIVVSQMSDIDIAIGIYRQFIEQNSGHPFNTFLEKMIVSLNLLKEKAKEGAAQASQTNE